jgi:hypothetical protein
MSFSDYLNIVGSCLTKLLIFMTYLKMLSVAKTMWKICGRRESLPNFSFYPVFACGFGLEGGGGKPGNPTIRISVL